MKDPRILGEITITATDEVTGKVNVIKKSNINISHAVLLQNGSVKRMQNRSLVVDPEIHHSNDAGMSLYSSSRIGAYVAASESQSVFENTLDDFWYEAVWRFPSSGAVQNIGTVGLQDSGNASFGKFLTSATLNSVYAQQPNELVDIKYRMIFETPADTAFAYKYKSFIDFLMNSASTFSSTCKINHSDCSGLWNKFTRITTESDAGVAFSTVDEGSTLIGKPDIEGKRILGTTLVRSSGGQTRTLIANMFDTIGDTYPNYPFGPLYNHRAGSSKWDEDVVQLALGLGVPVVAGTGVTWDSPTNVDRYSIRVEKEGNLGVAEFTWELTQLVGNVEVNGDNAYGNKIVPLGDMGESTPYITAYHSDYPLTIEDPFDDLQYTAVYDSHTIIAYADGKLSFLNIYTGEYLHFSADTAPPMVNHLAGRASANQIFRDDAGTVYICQGSVGIVKVVDPYGSPVISTIPVATIGSGFIKCGAHAGGNEIVVMDSTSIYTSTDNGASWSDETIASYTNLSGLALNGNFIVAIAFNHLNSDEMMVVQNTADLYGSNYERANTNNYSKYIWVDRSAKNSSQNTTATTYTKDVERYEIQCDPVHGVWMNCGKSSGASGAGRASFFMKFMSTPHAGVLHSDVSNNSSRQGSMYDNLGNLHFIAQVKPGSTSNAAFLDISGRCHVLLDIGFITGAGVNNHFGIRYDITDGYGKRRGFSYAGIVKYGTGKFSYGTVFRRDETVAGFAEPPEMGAYVDDSLWNELPDKLKYLWDDTASTWKEGWNESTPESTDGSNSVDISRVNFPANANRFNGRCYIDGTAAVDGLNANSGLAIIATMNHETRDVMGTGSNYFNSDYVNNEEGASGFFSIWDETAQKGFAVCLVNHNDQVSIMDYTDPSSIVETQLGASPATGVDSRVVMQLNAAGTIVEVSVNGASMGTRTLSNTFSVDNTSNNWKLSLGCLNINKFLLKTQYHHLFKGDMTNIQIWNRTLTGAEITTDSASPSGLIAGAGLISRYLMSAAYSEAKLINGTMNTLENNFTITFVDGSLATPSYMKDDRYSTTLVKDGILKGNVETLTLNSFYSHEYGEIATLINSAGTNTIPSAAAVVTEPFLANERLINDSTKFCNGGALSTGANESGGFTFCQTPVNGTSDYTIEFVVSRLDHRIAFVFNDAAFINPSNTYAGTNNHASRFFRVEIGDLDIVTQTNLTGVATDNTNALIPGDQVQIAITNGAYNVNKWDGAAWVSMVNGTFTAPPNSIKCSVWNMYLNSTAINAITEMTLTYNKPASIMQVGNAALDEGIYATNYAGSVIAKSVESNIFTMDSVTATDVVVEEATTANTTYSSLSFYNLLNIARPAGKLTFLPSGFVVCSDSDQGKVLLASSEFLTKINNKV